MTGLVLAVALAALGAADASAADPGGESTAAVATAGEPTTPAPVRPVPMFNRWQEDWSVLADPATPRQPLDGLKYIPFAAGGRTDWLTLGAQLRERFESNEEPGFGVTPGQGDAYVISRLEGFADVHAGPLQGFVELQSDFAPGKRTITMVDADDLDLEQAFVALVEPVGQGVLKLRVGRQQFAFDLQRFVSVRDGPNVRQSFDALWGDYEMGEWRIIAYYSQPVVNRDVRPFDDDSSGHNQFYGLRVERHVFGGQELSAYWSRFTNDAAKYLTVSGVEQRDVWDGRFAGHAHGYDWDLEGMGQTGAVGPDRVAAWAVGSRSGYTLAAWLLSPRLGLQVDAASGDGGAGDRTLNTFNPLFSNGYYVSLSGYTGYVNFIHAKPSVTIHPLPQLALMLAGAAQWRETTADAVYTQPNVPVPRTAGVGRAWTGAYAQTRMDWRISEHVTSAVEIVHFVVGETLRDAGGRDSDYFGVEGDYAW